MPQYQVIQQDGELYLPIRYDNFRAIGVRLDPPEPWAAIPLHQDVAGVVAEAREEAKDYADDLKGIGLGKLDGRNGEITYEDKLNFPFRFFRGETNTRYGMMPTRYRFTGQPDPLATVRERLRFETLCAEKMRAYLKSHGAPNATEEQARAAVRHHGVASSFIDFTFEPGVAAFFGHPRFTAHEQEHGAPMGILYSLGIKDFEGLFGIMAWSLPPDGGRDILSLSVHNVWQIPYRAFDPERRLVHDATLSVAVPDRLREKPLTIRTRLVPGTRRIAAQQGIFLDASMENPEDWWTQVFLWTVLDFASHKWAFVRKDFTYEDPEAGVTAAQLFPPVEPDLAELTKSFA